MKRRQSYADLEIRILKENEPGYPVELRLDGRQEFEGVLDTAILPWAAGASAEEDGVRLFRALFNDARLRDAWGQIRGQNERRRVRLRIDATAPELHAIPWELLREEGNGQAAQSLAATDATPFSRYLAGSWQPGRPIADRPVKMLVAIANPNGLAEFGLTEIDVGREQENIQAALAGLRADQLEVSYLTEGVSLPRLLIKLKKEVHLLHIVAHGTFSQRRGEASLYLADEDGDVRLVRETDLAGMLGQLAQPPRLVYLSGCETAARSPADAFRGFASRLIEAGIPAVLAMQDRVPMRTAQAFAQTFYRQLLDHGQVDVAANEARAAVVTADLPGSSIPALFSRLPDNRLFTSLEEAALEEASQLNYLQRFVKFFAGDSEQQRELRNRQIMLQRVHDFWVKGVLENSLHNEILIELGLETKPEAVEYPWEMVIERPDQPNRPLSPGTKMIDVFDESSGSLLILGEPGSGKTTMLLDLARQLIARAQSDLSHPIPVISNLSSWAEKSLPFEEWLIEELNTKYNFPKKLAQTWVDGDKLLLLLDGLDEVNQDHREGCLKAIRTFHKDRLAPVVVCSRITDYELMSERLNLQQAVVIQSLTSEQIFTYLANIGPELRSLQTILQSDVNLKELAVSPLMLSIMTLVYNDIKSDELLHLNAIEAQRRSIFERYVQHMFIRRGKDTTYPEERVRHWLSWLAQGMMEHSQTLFLIELLQPNWLPAHSSRRWAYTIGYRSLSGLIGGLLIGFSWGLLLGLFLWLDGSSSNRIILVISLLSLGLGLGLGVIGFITGLNLKLGISGAIETIKPVESLKWSWIGVKDELKAAWKQTETNKELKRGARTYIAFGLLIVFSLLGYAMNQQSWWVLTFAGVLLGTIILLTSGLTNVRIEQRIVPNQGIRQSVKYAVIMAVISGASFGLVIGLPVAVLSVLNFSSMVVAIALGLLVLLIFCWGFGSTAAVIGGFWYGGLAVVQHFLLRFILSKNGDLPWKLVAFLDYATEHIFLRKVGGGYIFVHRYLMEYFASLKRVKAQDSDVIAEQLLEQKRIKKVKLAIRGLVGILIMVGCIAFSVANNPLAFYYYIQGNIHRDNGAVEEAIQDFARATNLDRDNATYWNALCWQGSLAGQASEVINSCDQAVRLDPNDGAIRDSRGLARALTGDYEGAIDDFRFFVRWAEENRDGEGPFISPSVSSMREAWIAELQTGRNPFDEHTLAELENE